MKFRHRHYLLISLFVLYAIFRIVIALKTPYFTDDQSYYVLRQIESIRENGKPISQDPLSYGGRRLVVMPVYYYIMAAFNDNLWLKVVNNIFASSLVMFLYLIVRKIVVNRKITLVIALLATAMPAYLNQTINKLNPLSIVLPGSLLLLYQFMNLEQKKVDLIVITTILLVLSSSLTFIILLGLIIYLLLLYLINLKPNKIELEYVAFFTLFYLWSNFIIYKQAFIAHGLATIWRNTPSIVLSQEFSGLNILNSIASLGFMLLVFGIYTAYNYILRKKSRKVMIFISLFLSSFILYWARLIDTTVGLIYLNISLIILFGIFLGDLNINIKKTKISRHLIYLGLILLLVVSQSIPIIQHINTDSPYSEAYFDIFKWLNQNTSENSVIFAPIEEGHMITYYSKRKNVADNEYILSIEPNTRINDINSFYKNKFKIDALRILDNYNATYFIFSDVAKQKYGIETLGFVDKSCFTIVHNDIYQRSDECEIIQQ